MADIKEVAKQTIKTIDKASIAQEKIKDVGIKTKDAVKETTETNDHNPSDYAANKTEVAISTTTTIAAHTFNKIGRRSYENTKNDIKTVRERVQEKRKGSQPDIKTSTDTITEITDVSNADSIKTVGNKTIKTKSKADSKIVNNTVKTVEKGTKAVVKDEVLKQETVKHSVKGAKKAEAVARESAREAAKFAKKAYEVFVKVLKGTMHALKSIVSAIIAGGWVSVVVIVLICIIGAVAGSVYGIFYSAEDNGTGMTVRSVVQEINADFDEQINAIKTSGTYDSVEINGTKANWKDVLAIFAVKTTTDATNPQEVVIIDDTKKGLLSNIFWDMNTISSKNETRTETREVETTDEDGNVVKTTEEVTITALIITIESKTANDMISVYSFDKTQKEYLAELLDDSNNSLWNSLIYNVGISGNIDFSNINFDNENVNDTQKKIVAVAVNYSDYGISAGSGYCQAWVADVYQAVTGSRGSAHCALCAADMWAVSSDWSKIPVGATVYGYASNPYGHVGIYIGNGMVIHNLSGNVISQSLDSWVTQFKGFSWGWEYGKVLK